MLYSFISLVFLWIKPVLLYLTYPFTEKDIIIINHLISLDRIEFQLLDLDSAQIKTFWYYHSDTKYIYLQLERQAH